MPKATVKVCIRTRPTANFAHAEIGVDPDKGSVTINQHPGAVPDDGAPYNKQDAHKFKYHHVIHNASQETVYHTLTQDVATSVIKADFACAAQTCRSRRSSARPHDDCFLVPSFQVERSQNAVAR